MNLTTSTDDDSWLCTLHTPTGALFPRLQWWNFEHSMRFHCIVVCLLASLPALLSCLLWFWFPLAKQTQTIGWHKLQSHAAFFYSIKRNFWQYFRKRFNERVNHKTSLLKHCYAKRFPCEMLWCFQTNRNRTAFCCIHFNHQRNRHNEMKSTCWHVYLLVHGESHLKFSMCCFFSILCWKVQFVCGEKWHQTEFNSNNFQNDDFIDYFFL